MRLEEAVKGVLDCEDALRRVGNQPVEISRLMYELGQYASAAEKILGEYERDYEEEWAQEYKQALDTKHIENFDKPPKPMSPTAAKQHADVETADTKGQIKYLTRFVASAWKVQTAAMARIKHLEQERRSDV